MKAPPTEQNEPEATPPATLNPNGKAWFIHPIGITMFNQKYQITVDFLEKVIGKIGK